MKHVLLIIAVVALVGCKYKSPTVEIADPIIEKEIRRVLEKPSGELTKADLKKVTRLNLYYNKLTEVPKELEKLTQLNDLVLEYNQLTSVKGLEKLTKLSTLNLIANQLTSVKGLEKLTQLSTLYLFANQLTEPPKELEKLTKLRELTLQSHSHRLAHMTTIADSYKVQSYNHRLTSVKRLEKLTQLESLHLRDNLLTELPKGLEKLTQLEALWLDANQLTDVKGLEKLTQLRKLSLEENQLTDVKGLEKLTQLQTLWLTNNPDLTKAQIDQLQKALPKCRIFSNPTK